MSLADSSSAGPSALTVGPVLYDQLNGQTTTNPADISSQDFETSLDAADSEAADDFVVPAGLTWSIDGIDVDGEYFSRDGLDPVPAGFHVRFWSNDAATNLPSALSAARLSQPYTAFGTELGDVQIALELAGRAPGGDVVGLGAGAPRLRNRDAAVVLAQPHRAMGPGRRLAEPRRSLAGALRVVRAPLRLSGHRGRARPGLPAPRHRRARRRAAAALRRHRHRHRLLRPLRLAAGCRGSSARSSDARSRSFCAPTAGSAGSAAGSRALRRHGKVLAQSPRAGRSLPFNSRVKLVVGRR